MTINRLRGTKYTLRGSSCWCTEVHAKLLSGNGNNEVLGCVFHHVRVVVSNISAALVITSTGTLLEESDLEKYLSRNVCIKVVGDKTTLIIHSPAPQIQATWQGCEECWYIHHRSPL